MFETDAVPLLQIVLDGCAEQFSTANYVVRGENLTDILRLIDYNVYPQFTLTAADEMVLAKTNSNMIYCSQFDVLSDEIKTIYQMVNDSLSLVQGASVVQREVPQDDLVITSYSNGWSILINYSDQLITVSGICLPGCSALTVRTDQLAVGWGD